MPALRDKVTLRRLGSRTLPPEIWQRPKQPYRAPMTGPLFGANETDLVAELLSPSAILRLGVADPKAAALLVDKARRRDGHLAGEREEMALVGLLTIQILAHAYLEDFDARARRRRQQLDASEMHVFVDLAGAARSQIPAGASSTPGPTPGLMR
jgi:asparagine synthase (glutamine-hydrolysing)